MKQTPEDLAFATRFAKKLKPVYERARQLDPDKPKVQFDKRFAATLGVNRAALWKYLYGRKPPTPSIGTIVKAFEIYGVAVRYNRIETKDVLRSARRSKLSFAAQLELPFSIRATGNHTVNLKLEPKPDKSSSEWMLRISTR